MKNKSVRKQRVIEEEITVAEELQENEEVTQVSKIQQLIINNKYLVIGLCAGIILVIAVVLIFFTNKDAKENEASLVLSRVMPYFSNSNFELALNGEPKVKIRGESVVGMLGIVDKYAGTASGKLAALYVGNIYLFQNKFKEAEEYFDIALKANSKLVQTGANAGLGACLESKNKFEEAAEYYEVASKLAVDDGTVDRYLYYTGLCYEKAKKSSEAEKYYREIVNKNQFSEFLNSAKSGLIRIGTIIE